ncbi:hypothetical protein [Chryseobacterium taiwanense]|uniref:Lipoprotein n=1 Tax=Chryseobacterium taiwanense TaxID=363331 RepID=A0A0B4CZ49_9FLAO|nr:hypothetical protein [Chryseobacterium taiwanense]KIC61647.1 hypothetical protein RM51_14690 [Chryseobacterium taiwanense]
MKNITFAFYAFILASCSNEEIKIAPSKSSQKSFVSYMIVGDNKKNEKVIELHIPLEFSIQNTTSKVITIPAIADFTSPVWNNNIKGGLNSNFYLNKKILVEEKLTFQPNEHKSITLYYTLSILNAKKECISNFDSQLKKSDTVFIDKEDSCLKNYSNYIKSTSTKFHYLSKDIVISNTQQ